MLLINPSRAYIMANLPAGTLSACLDSFPGGRCLALSTDGPYATLATATHCGAVVERSDQPVILWMAPAQHYALAYNETLKCWQVASAKDEYALPADHQPIHGGYGSLLVTVYARSTVQVGDPVTGYTLFRLKVPHTLDGLPGMFRQD